jgi:response regulator RpfG family c-di-GMP phosphodiesterase
MAASDVLLVDDAQDSCTSLSEVIWDLDYQGSGAYDGPAARELSQRYTSNLALLNCNSPGTAGVELDGQLKQVQHGQLKQVQPGTAAVRVTGFAAEVTVSAATQANIGQVMLMPVDLGRLILPIEELAGGP